MEPASEVELVALVRAGAFERAATRALELYGGELFGFLINYVGNESDADEVFSQVGEDLWKGLPAFGFRCSVRTWLYVLARHAAARYRRSPWRRAREGDSQLDQAIAKARTGTAPWLQTEVKDRWRALREGLDPDDRLLLVLRVDRDLPWEDCARVTLEEEAPDAAALTREAARLRKRFQIVKDDLRTRAKQAGLIE
ncbi:MAG: sigma-70 family RNA polymerase sigma factor [Deltaproteobacteria bacterium]|nr:sigma-70 family RNA polymerase sigma factor [Deltaproteobacteria bacterium]